MPNSGRFPNLRRAIPVALFVCLADLVFSGCTPGTISREAPGLVERTLTSPADRGQSGEHDGLSPDQAASLASLRMIDDYPLYIMHYYGDYGELALTPFPAGPSLGPGSKGSTTARWACSLFATLGGSGFLQFGRNFDWEYSPALLLYTDPPDGYASVSMVDIAYLGFDDAIATTLINLPLSARSSLLETPFLPFDGMNEHGLVVGMAAVPEQEMPYDAGLKTVDSLYLIRMLLDHAADVDEAVGIIRGVNLDWGSGPALHYLLADRGGHAALVEFVNGELVVLKNEQPWHLGTNFLRSLTGEDSASGCWRYDALQGRLSEAHGRATSDEALRLLEQVSQENTQWSIVYGIESGNVDIVMGRDFEQAYSLDFHLQRLR
jgi:hypothetical protein